MQNSVADNLQLSVVDNKQKAFFETAIGKAINKAINYGLKKIFPDFIEDSIIEIKDELLKKGVIDGIKFAFNKTLDFGKSAIGTIRGTFEKISQMQFAVNKGGVIDIASKVIDNQIKNVEQNELLSKQITTVIKNGKNIIKNDLKNNINKELEEQKNLIKKIEKNFNNWEKAFEQKDLEKMEKEYNKMLQLKNNIIPIEEINNKIETINNINSLIKNKNSFNISKLEIQLANKI